MTDQGSDCNLLCPDTFKLIEDANNENLDITKLAPAVSFTGVGKSKISCSKKVILDIQLRVRHGSRLILRKVEWLISDQPILHSLLGRPLLDAIGCNNKKMINIICDKHDGEIDMAEMMSNRTIDEQNNNGSIATLLLENIYHSAGGSEQDGLEEEDIYIDLGEDTEEDINNALEQRINEAKDKGL